MDITLLAQGSTVQERARKHWGVAFLLGREILFDTFGNAQALLDSFREHRVDMARIKHIIISHEHWDHTSGLWSILPSCPKVSVHVCQRTSKEFKQKIVSFGAHLVEVKGATRIASGVHTTGQLRGRLGKTVIYEQSLVLPSSKGFILLTGCSHPGIDRIVSHACKEFQQRPLWVTGGFHLKDSKAAIVRRVAQKLLSKGVQRISPFHCTGEAAARIFQKSFGQKYFSWPVGKTVSTKYFTEL